MVEREKEARKFSWFIWSTAAILLTLFALLLWRGMRAAARANDPFAALLAGGLTLQIGLYALANLAVATGLAVPSGPTSARIATRSVIGAVVDAHTSRLAGPTASTAVLNAGVV